MNRTFRAHGIPCSRCARPLAVYWWKGDRLIGLHARVRIGGGDTEYFECDRSQTVTIESL